MLLRILSVLFATLRLVPNGEAPLFRLALKRTETPYAFDGGGLNQRIRVFLRRVAEGLSEFPVRLDGLRAPRAFGKELQRQFGDDGDRGSACEGISSFQEALVFGLCHVAGFNGHDGIDANAIHRSTEPGHGGPSDRDERTPGFGSHSGILVAKENGDVADDDIRIVQV